MANAAHSAVVSVATAVGGTYTEIDGLNDASIQLLVDLLETTDFKDTTGAKTRIYGLSDSSASIAGDYEPADTLGQVLVRAAATGKTNIFVKVLADGTNGYRQEFLVESFDIKAGVADKATFSASLKGTGATVAIP